MSRPRFTAGINIASEFIGLLLAFIQNVFWGGPNDSLIIYTTALPLISLTSGQKP